MVELTGARVSIVGSSSDLKKLTNANILLGRQTASDQYYGIAIEKINEIMKKDDDRDFYSRIEIEDISKLANSELIASYWKIGEIIVRYEQNDSIRAE